MLTNSKSSDIGSTTHDSVYGLRHFVVDNFHCREAGPYLKLISLISAKIDAKNVARSLNKIITDFNAMNVAELKKYLQVPGDFSEQIVENFDCGNRLRNRKIGFANGSKFLKGRHHLLKPFNNPGDENS